MIKTPEIRNHLRTQKDLYKVLKALNRCYISLGWVQFEADQKSKLAETQAKSVILQIKKVEKAILKANVTPLDDDDLYKLDNSLKHCK